MPRAAGCAADRGSRPRAARRCSTRRTPTVRRALRRRSRRFRRASFQSHLFARAELERLAAQGFDVEEIRGLDLFHSRFASDPRWNPKNTAFAGRLAQELGRLEDRYCCDPGFVDHAAHLLLVARHKAMVRP